MKFLNEISLLLQKYVPTYFISGSDYNTDFSRNSLQTDTLNKFMDAEKCINVTNVKNVSIDHTFSSHDGKYFSTIDHFLVGENVKPFVISYKTTDNIENVSDHLALRCTFNLYIDYSVSLNEDPLGHCVWPKASMENIYDYKCALNKNLCDISVDKDLVTCNDLKCTKHTSEIDNLYNEINKCCIVSAEQTIPQTNSLLGKSKDRKGTLPGWNEFVEPHRQRALMWHDIWVNQNRPRNGIVAQIRRSTRLSYHREIRKVKKEEDTIRNLRLYENIKLNSSSSLWSEIKRMKGRVSSNPKKIDSANSNLSIARLFMEKFSKLYNSVSYDGNDMKILSNKICDDIKCKCISDNCVNHCCCITVNDISSSVEVVEVK